MTNTPTNPTNPLITIDIRDVDREGSVAGAIKKECESAEIATATPEAMGGQTFACSGPGSGWQHNFDAGDYARAAIQEDLANSGANESAPVVDPDDGKIAVGAVTREEDEDEDGDTCEESELNITWSEGSVVELKCPDPEDALYFPEALGKMVRALDIHHGCTDLEEWGDLLLALADAAAECECADADDLRAAAAVRRDEKAKAMAERRKKAAP